MTDETRHNGPRSGLVRVGEDLVCGDDQPYFPAQLGELQWAATDDLGRRYYTVTPRFRRVVAEWVATTVEATSDHLGFLWDGNILVIVDDAAIDLDDPTSAPAVERIRPDADGRYTFETCLWHLPDDAAKRLDENAQAALTLLAHDDPQPIDTLIGYVAENTRSAPDPQALRDIRHQHRTRTTLPAAPRHRFRGGTR
jgi:hypothetical protein